MASCFSFPLSTLGSVWGSAIQHKIQDWKQQASYEMQKTPAFTTSGNSFNQAISRFEPIVGCIESSLISFFKCSYNGGIALLATIPALIKWNSQPIFPNIKKFWKKRLYQTGVSFGIGVTEVLVLTKLTGLIHLTGSIVCYFKPKFRPGFQEVNQMRDAHFRFLAAMTTTGIVAANIDQKNIIKEANAWIALALYCAKPKVIEKIHSACKTFCSKPIAQKTLNDHYDEKCKKIIRHLNMAKDVKELKNIAFILCKDACIKTVDICNTQAVTVLEHMQEEVPAISRYYRTEFSRMKDSLKNADDFEGVKPAISDFVTAIYEIFNGLKEAFNHEKNRCANEIALSLSDDKEKFEDALEDQPWFLEP